MVGASLRCDSARADVGRAHRGRFPRGRSRRGALRVSDSRARGNDGWRPVGVSEQAKRDRHLAHDTGARISGVHRRAREEGCCQPGRGGRVHALRSVLAQQERAYETKVHPNVAFTHDVLAKLASRQGRLSDAEHEYEQSADIERQLYGHDDYKTAVETGSLADILVREGQYQRAEEIIRPAVAAITRQPRPGDAL